jgi:pantetheine-phosphate adenylyltransferase
MRGDPIEDRGAARSARGRDTIARMANRAVYPGSFDPVTFGHLDLIQRGSRLFDQLVVAIGVNAAKAGLFGGDERVAMVRNEVKGIRNVEVAVFDGLVVDFARSRGLNVILRGLRTVSDFEAEFQMALTNRSFAPDVETVFVMPGEKFQFISSRLIKEVAMVGGSVTSFVPAAVAEALKRRFAKR